jgi:hypothetical protein
MDLIHTSINKSGCPTKNDPQKQAILFNHFSFGVGLFQNCLNLEIVLGSNCNTSYI